MSIPVIKDYQSTSRRQTTAASIWSQNIAADSAGEYATFTHDYRWETTDGEYVPLRSRSIVRFEDTGPCRNGRCDG